MSTSCCPWWTGDTRDNISNYAFTLLPLMFISSTQGQFPLLFRWLCIPKQIGQPLWGSAVPVPSVACTTQNAGRPYIYRERVWDQNWEQSGLLRECLTQVPRMSAVANRLWPSWCTFSCLPWSKNPVADSWWKYTLAGQSGQWYAADIVEEGSQKTSLTEGHTGGISSFRSSLPTLARKWWWLEL